MLEVYRTHADSAIGRIRLGICMLVIFIVAMVFGLLIVAKPYAVHATGEKVQDPWVVKADGEEIAVVDSKEAADSIITGVRAAYAEDIANQQDAEIKNNIAIEKYSFDDKKVHPAVMDTEDAVDFIVKKNETKNPALEIETTEVIQGESKISYKTEKVETDDYFKGEKRIQTGGTDGKSDVEKEVTKVNGKIVNENVLSEKVLKKPVNKVVLVGTKERPKAAPATSSNNSSSSNSSSSSYSGGSSASYSAPAYSGNGSAVSNFALQFVGNPYVYGGSSLTNGADCSGFTMAVYAKFGISLPHSSYAQEGYGTSVPVSQAKPGDLVCYGSHVGIYIGGGQMVHASTPSGGIKVGPIGYRPVSAIKRLI